MVSTPIIQYYYTQFIGDPTAPAKPTIKGMANFQGIALIDTDVYIPSGNGSEWYINQNQFYRQIRNLRIDLTAMPNNNTAGDQTYVPTGIHWQVSQSTSLQNIDVVMPQGGGTTAVGIFTENGSGGFMSDLTFFGGNIGMRVGSQQFTARDITFTSCAVAVSMIWDWGWTWKNIRVISAYVAFDCTSFGGNGSQGTGSLTVVDSHFSSVPFAIPVDSKIQPAITLDNLLIDGNTPSVVLVSGGATILEGTTGAAQTIKSWAMGRRYTGLNDSGETTSGDLDPPPSKPAMLIDSNGAYFVRSKPQYETLSAGSFINVADFGATGDGTGDQSSALNAALSAAHGAVVFIPAGVYPCASTVNVPVGSRIVGEAWPQIMATGHAFSDPTNPTPLIRVGNPGDEGVIEISDLLFTVSGPTAGAVLLEWNVREASQGSAAMWDSHFRVGGAFGSKLQAGDCPASNAVDLNCMAASLLMHVTASASGYFENNWLWVADHDIDTPAQTQINIFSGRGLLVESQGPLWLYGGASEHSVLYQYQFAKSSNVYIGHMQTETPYFQPSPTALNPFPIGVYASDPIFEDCTPSNLQCQEAWALLIRNSTNIFIYGAGFYSFFQGYAQGCLDSETCQQRLVQTDFSEGIWMYSQYTKGATECVSPLGGIAPVRQSDNRNGFLTAISAWLPLSLTGADIGGFNGSVDKPSPLNLLPVPGLDACGSISCGQTVTLSSACASQIAALPTSGANNNPPVNNCLESCDIFRLMTGTCCGTGGSVCFGIQIPPDGFIPAPFPITQGFVPSATITIPGFDSSASPTTTTFSPGTPIPFPLVIPPGPPPLLPGGPPLVVPPEDPLPDDPHYVLIVLEKFQENGFTDLGHVPTGTSTSSSPTATPTSVIRIYFASTCVDGACGNNWYAYESTPSGIIELCEDSDIGSFLAPNNDSISNPPFPNGSLQFENQCTYQGTSTEIGTLNCPGFAHSVPCSQDPQHEILDCAVPDGDTAYLPQIACFWP
jgi:hypothetical protein